jgi:hypothetical protein
VRFVLAAKRIKMLCWVIIRVHSNEDSEEFADCRHATVLGRPLRRGLDRNLGINRHNDLADARNVDSSDLLRRIALEFEFGDPFDVARHVAN